MYLKPTLRERLYYMVEKTPLILFTHPLDDEEDFDDIG